MKMKERLIGIKRDLIVDVAKNLFFKQGYENTTIDDIAYSAGISKSTLYTYIKSKEELFMYIHLQGMRERVTLLNEVLLNIGSGLEKIRAIGHEYYHYFKKNIGFFRLYMFEDYNTLDRKKISKALYGEFSLVLEKLIKIVTDSLDNGIRDKSIRSDINIGYLDKYFAYTIRSILNVAFSPEKVHNLKGKFDEEEFYLQYVDIFIEAIKNSN